MSLCQYVTGTTLVLIFICTGTVHTAGKLVPVDRDSGVISVIHRWRQGQRGMYQHRKK